MRVPGTLAVVLHLDGAVSSILTVNFYLLFSIGGNIRRGTVTGRRDRLYNWRGKSLALMTVVLGLCPKPVEEGVSEAMMTTKKGIQSFSRGSSRSMDAMRSRPPILPIIRGMTGESGGKSV